MVSHPRIRTCHSSCPTLFAHPPNWSKRRESSPPLARVASTGRLFTLRNVETSTIERDRHYCGPRARCSAMSPLPRICIQAYADKQHRRARAALEYINPPGSQPKGHTDVSRLSLRICIYRCARCLSFSTWENQKGVKGGYDGMRHSNARRNISPNLTIPFRNFHHIYICIYVPLLQARAVSKDFYRKSVK